MQLVRQFLSLNIQRIAEVFVQPINMCTYSNLILSIDALP